MAQEHRDYGEDAYWISRHDRKRKREEDVTDEWLLSWAALQQLLANSLVRCGDKVLDLGCGTSPLALDLLRDHLATRIMGIDIAPGAIEHQLQEQRSRIAKGEASASRASFAVVDVTRPGTLSNASYDACIDKSTTDGLLCDTKRAHCDLDPPMHCASVFSSVGGLLLVSCVSAHDAEIDGCLSPVVRRRCRSCAPHVCQRRSRAEAQPGAGCCHRVQLARPRERRRSRVAARFGAWWPTSRRI